MCWLNIIIEVNKSKKSLITNYFVLKNKIKTLFTVLGVYNKKAQGSQFLSQKIFLEGPETSLSNLKLHWVFFKLLKNLAVRLKKF